MTQYAEKYEIPGDCFYGIEGPRKVIKENGQFPFKWTPGQKRYQVWRGGGGIGQANEIVKARAIVQNVAVDSMRERIAQITAELKVLNESVYRLTEHGLSQFKVELFEFEKPEALAKALTS